MQQSWLFFFHFFSTPAVTLCLPFFEQTSYDSVSGIFWVASSIAWSLTYILAITGLDISDEYVLSRGGDWRGADVILLLLQTTTSKKSYGDQHSYGDYYKLDRKTPRGLPISGRPLLHYPGFHSSVSTFTIQVTLGDLNAMASGSSKKAAKRGAAQAMLHLLKQTKPNQTTTPSPDQSSTSVSKQTSISDATQKVQQTLVSGNCVGALQELCTKRFLPLPKYDLEQSFGSSHQPQFSMVCVVQHRRKVGVAGNKKAAKMEAARAMLVDIEEGLEEENKKDETKVEDEGGSGVKCEQGKNKM